MFQGGGNEGGSCEDCFDRGLWNEANWRWGGCFWECVMRSSQEADDSGPHQEGECACSGVVAERPQCLVLLEPIPFSWPYVVCYCVVCLLVKWRVCCLKVEWWMEYNTNRRVEVLGKCTNVYWLEEFQGMGLPVMETCFFLLNASFGRVIFVRDGMSRDDSQQQKELSRVMKWI